MNIRDFNIEALKQNPVFGTWPLWETVIPVNQLFQLVESIHASQGKLFTLWGTDERSKNNQFHLHLIFIIWETGTFYIRCELPDADPAYPDLSSLFPIATRLQRATFDLLGIKAVGSFDERSWLRHEAWPDHFFPLHEKNRLAEHFIETKAPYAFVPVSGEGVHEIAVGPVHAGIIESGHFRFQVVGERILRLEARLGYVHKGIHKHFQGSSFSEGARLAGRISGDNTVAYAWAYSMAVENLHQYVPNERTQVLRALLLERERVMNHLGDLGALGNDAGLTFGLTQFSRLKEMMLRQNAQLFGHRYLMDLIIPGGVKINIATDNILSMQKEIDEILREMKTLKYIYHEHEGLQDRFLTTGSVSTTLAETLGLLGFTARASGLAIDWRIQFPCSIYTTLKICTHTEGDVSARIDLRFQEIENSLHLMKILLQQLPQGTLNSELPTLKTFGGIAHGCVEGWRGPVWFSLCNENATHLRWAHFHDPSWQNWQALEHAVLGNIVPDFPLINKSFNLSYSGHDG